MRGRRPTIGLPGETDRINTAFLFLASLAPWRESSPALILLPTFRVESRSAWGHRCGRRRLVRTADPTAWRP